MDEPLSNLDAKLRVQMRAEIARLQNRLGATTVYVTHDQTEAMTLGDRVVVLLAGVVQQIGTPEELYNSPANLFVAGFIGSPAMNFFPATMTDVGVRLPFGDITLTQEVHDLLAQHPTANNVIVGIRPEHLEDAAVIDTYARIRALTFEVTVDFVESLGADKYVHFKTEGGGAQAAQLAELAADSGVNENEFVARVSTESTAAPGQTMELAFDTSKITIFDADTGANLTIAPSGSNGQVPESPVAPAAPPPPPPSEQAPSEQAPSEQAPSEQASPPPPPAE
jgi:multiple sugar transport system ATP-binding protein